MPSIDTLTSTNKPLPTNLNGVVDPSSPLASLYANDYDFTNLSYPRDLGSHTRGHYVNFYINTANKSQYTQEYQTDAKGQTFAGNAQTLQNQEGSSYVSTVNVPGTTLTLGRQTKRIKQAISLYMPSNLEFKYNAEWETTNLTDAMGQGMQTALGIVDSMGSLGGFGKTLWSTASSSAVYAEALSKQAGIPQNLAMHAVGYAVNPQLEVLFKGSKLRTFEFVFKFASFSQQESENIKEIIKAFKFHQAPEIVPNVAAGRYMVPPSEFDIMFVQHGRENTNIGKISTCVLDDVSVTYGGEGAWSTFMDGTPVSMSLHLGFTEVEIMTKSRIQQGY